jgi:broad specificity phosphatase PhoE
MGRAIRSLWLALALAPTVRAQRPQPTTVILVRHAEKTSQTDNDPALSDAGIQRAKDLAAALADAQVGTVIVTQYKRTMLTAASLVAAAKAPMIVTIPTVTGMDAHLIDVVATVKARPAGETVLIVGHSNTITAIIAALGGPKLPNICDSQYSNLFILELTGSNPPPLIRAHYGAADPVDPTCTTMKVP